MLWGVKAFYYDKFESTDKTVEQVNAIAQENGWAEAGDMLINLAAMPIKEKGMVNTLRVFHSFKKAIVAAPQVFLLEERLSFRCF